MPLLAQLLHNVDHFGRRATKPPASRGRTARSLTACHFMADCPQILHRYFTALMLVKRLAHREILL
jgi:hypothetical protein